jgi:hypothetical protein
LVGGTGVGVNVGELVGTRVSVGEPAGTVGRSRVGSEVEVAMNEVTFAALVSIKANEKLPKTMTVEMSSKKRPPNNSLRKFMAVNFSLIDHSA